MRARLYSHDYLRPHMQFVHPARRDFSAVTESDTHWARVLSSASVTVCMNCSVKHPKSGHRHRMDALKTLSIALWLAGYQRGQGSEATKQPPLPRSGAANPAQAQASDE